MRDIIETYYESNFNILVKKNSRRAGSEMGGEDIVQEAFYRALKYSGSFNPKVHTIENWIGTIINNCANDFRAAQMPCSHPVEEPVGDTAEDEFIRARNVEEVAKIILAYPHPANEILSLWFFNQYSLKDINQVSGASMSCIKMTINRFKKRMRRCYDDDCSDKR